MLPRRCWASSGCCFASLLMAVVTAVDLQLGSEELLVSLESADGQPDEREPDGTSPVGVPAEHPRGRLGGLVIDRGADAFDVQHRSTERLFKLFDEGEFLSPYGLRSLSAYHRD